MGYTLQGLWNGGYNLQMSGFSLLSVSNVTIRNTTIRSFYADIYLNYSSNDVLSNNNITGRSFDGIAVFSSSDNNTLSDNNITPGGFGGIHLWSSSGNVLSGNKIAQSSYGVYSLSSSGNVLSGNNVTANGYCIVLDSSDNNTLSDNNVTANGQGITLYSSSGNRIFHNVFNNTGQAYTENSTNKWDEGYPSGGNYWSDYSGVDLKSGPYQNVTGSDGIGDTPYIIATGNIDHYPLTIPYGSHLPLAFPSATFIYEPAQPVAGKSVIFNASASTCVNGSIKNYEWDFGDGYSGTGIVTPHTYSTYGYYNVTLTVLSNTFIPDTQEQLIHVKDRVTAGFSFSPNLKVGNPITFNASASSLYGGNTTTLITSYVWGFGDGNITSTVGPITNHTYTYANTFNVTLTVLDNEGLNSSFSSTILVIMPTIVSIHTSSSSSVVGFNVNINGSLTDFYGEPLENETVVISYTFQGATSWFPISSSVTDTSGNYYVQWVPTATGYFTIKVEWAGNATYSETSSTATLSSLAYKNQYVFSVESNSTISALAFNSTDQTLSFTASGPSGTRGYTRVTIAKSLVANATNIRVYLDGSQTQYSIASTDDSWLLTFNYTHSTHKVVVNLNINAIPEFPSLLVLLLFLITILIVIAICRSEISRISQNNNSKRRLNNVTGCSFKCSFKNIQESPLRPACRLWV
jgi:parallel beta-helix repeat protein